YSVRRLAPNPRSHARNPPFCSNPSRIQMSSRDTSAEVAKCLPSGCRENPRRTAADESSMERSILEWPFAMSADQSDHLAPARRMKRSSLAVACEGEGGSRAGLSAYAAWHRPERPDETLARPYSTNTLPKGT